MACPDTQIEVEHRLTIRPERPCDIAAIAEVTRRAFLTCTHSDQTEHVIIRNLREQGALIVSLVAEVKERIVGHIGFSVVTLSDASEGWYGLGSVSVEPGFQSQGIGSALIKHGLAVIRARGAAGCVLLGEPDFYQRFRFRHHASLVLDGVPGADKDDRTSYVKGDPFPDMTSRRPELVPAALPARVRYRFSDDSLVERLSDRLQAALQKGDASVFGDPILVQPGARSVLQGRGSWTSETGSVTVLDPNQGPLTGARQGKILGNRQDTEMLATELAQLLAEEGGFDVRSFTTAEMAKWWVYIGFDIEEPVYVVATRNGRYKFVIGFIDNERVFLVDELNALPDAV